MVDIILTLVCSHYNGRLLSFCLVLQKFWNGILRDPVAAQKRLKAAYFRTIRVSFERLSHLFYQEKSILTFM